MVTEPEAHGSGAVDDDRKSPSRWMGWWPAWLPSPKTLFAIFVVVALVVVVYEARSEFARALRHLSVDRLPWLAAAVAAEAVSFACYAAVQRRLLLSGGARLQRRTVLALAVAATGLTNLVPGGTAPASGWLVGQYRRHGIPMPLALWAVLAGGYAAAISVLFLLLLGAAIAGFIGILATIGCAVVLVGGGLGLVVAFNHADAVERWLDHHGFPGAGLLQRLLGHVAGVVRFRPSVPAGLQVLAFSLGNWGMDVVCLLAAFEVLGLPVPWAAILFAYAAAQVAGSLAPVPGGIGFVEGGMIGAFALAGTPATDAVLATLVYRIITAFGVAGVGSGALLFVTHRDPRKASLHGEAAADGGDRRDEPHGKRPARLRAAAEEVQTTPA